jgi:hypothetical protein
VDQSRGQSLLQLRDRATDERLGAVKGMGGGGEPVVLTIARKTCISRRRLSLIVVTLSILEYHMSIDVGQGGATSNEFAHWV